MRRALPVLAAVTVLVAAAGCGGKSQPLRIGGSAPAIDAPAIVDGQRARTADLAGRGYLVNFWGTWCEPCQRELPRLVAAGAPVFGVAVKSSKRQANEQLAAAGATWQSANDPNGSVAARWGVASGFPVTFAVDPAGKVRARHFGEMSDADIAELLTHTR